MNIEVVSKPLSEVKTQLLVLTVFEDEEYIGFPGLDDKVNEKLANMMASKEITGSYKEYTIIHLDGCNAERILVMGLGKKHKFTLERLMAISAIGARNLRRINCYDMAIASTFHEIKVSVLKSCRAIVEGIGLGLYKFKKHAKIEPKDYRAVKNLQIVLVGEEPSESAQAQAEIGKVLYEATNMARDLVNEPANYMTPDIFAARATEVAERNNIKIKVLGKEEIEAENMNAFLAVNKGSYEPPRLVVMDYQGAADPEDEVLGLVGKGITFDSGGLSIKSTEGMYRMHCDMAGAAAVLGAMECIAKNKLPINVVAVIPLTENLIDAHAYKVGDVLTTREGTTIEILSTDAEGRLILADALSYIRDYRKLNYLVDIATLTGAIVTALGHFCSGAMSNNKEFYRVVESASYKSGEKVWPLPMFEDYKAQIKSDIADIENSGGRAACSITAALLLKEFVGNVPWVHIDIAGTAYMDESVKPYIKNPFLPKEGATGVGTRLLYYLAEILSKGYHN